MIQGFRLSFCALGTCRIHVYKRWSDNENRDPYLIPIFGRYHLRSETQDVFDDFEFSEILRTGSYEEIKNQCINMHWFKQCG